jgi:peptidoglycan-N-acetylglucosamine deacetylase
MKHPKELFALAGTLLPLLLGCCVMFSPCRAGAEVITGLGVDAVALTFDACESKTPSFFDEKILSYLIEEKIPFTVFITGKFARRNSERLKQIARLPFVEIENHSYSHRQHMERLKDDEIRKEVKRLDDLVMKLTGRRTKYFRFPAGSYDARALRVVEGMNYKAVGWSYESGDPNRALTPARLTDRVLALTHAGDILIFHINGRGYCTGEVLPYIIEALREEGVEFVKLEDGGF